MNNSIQQFNDSNFDYKYKQFIKLYEDNDKIITDYDEEVLSAALISLFFSANSTQSKYLVGQLIQEAKRKIKGDQTMNSLREEPEKNEEDKSKACFLDDVDTRDLELSDEELELTTTKTKTTPNNNNNYAYFFF